jgi:hypothetical protein
MSRRHHRSRYQLEKRSQRAFRGYPIAAIAYYGPDDTRATKVVVGVVRSENQAPEASALRKWFVEGGDIRFDPAVNDAIVQFVEEQGAASVVMPGRIIGCPHEEGIDYPQGETCPECPFWADKDRWTGQVVR